MFAIGVQVQYRIRKMSLKELNDAANAIGGAEHVGQTASWVKLAPS